MNDAAAVRRLAYTLMIAVAASLATARIFSAERVYEPHLTRNENEPADGRSVWPKMRPTPMPTFSSNDRSRWTAVRALVDNGTPVIGRREIVELPADSPSFGAVFGPMPSSARHDTGIVFESGWDSVDKVLNPNTHEFYSTKPPLLTTLVAGEYWALNKLFGWTLTGEPWHVVGVILVTFNVLPLIAYLVLLARLVERFGTTDWGKLFVMAAACFGTLMTPFLNSLNNHTVATCCALFALYAAIKIDTTVSLRNNLLYVVAGLLAGFTACNELPALALTGLLGLMLLARSSWRAVVLYGGAALLPLAAEILNDYLANGEWLPIYFKVGGPWYEYEGSHWVYTPGRHGIDFARKNGETVPWYAFHLFLGHHGFFSLTPIYFLGLAGMVAAVSQVRQEGFGRRKDTPISWPEIGTLTLVLSAVIFTWYIFKSDNYGGFSNGPRWLMWLAPFWLLTMLPVVDGLCRSRWGRGLALLLLALSIFSASYSSWNPWRHPWLYDWMNSRHWIAY
jgi:hypothetical protein